MVGQLDHILLEEIQQRHSDWNIFKTQNTIKEIAQTSLLCALQHDFTEATDSHRPQSSRWVTGGSPVYEDMCGLSVILFSLPLHGNVSLAEVPLQQSGPSWGP